MKDSVRSLGVLIVGLVILSIAFAGCTTSQKTATSGESTTLAPLATGTPVATTVIPCPAGFADCNGACRDITSDVLNCGGCANTCPTSSTCKDSQCLCKEGYAACNGQCQDVTNDTANCGACKNQCSVKEKCTNGVCTAPGSSNSGQQSVATCPSSDLTVCGDYCVNLKTDAANCAACGNTCPNGMVCANGVCENPIATCTGGYTLCNGNCALLNTDNQNCGSCGKVCTGGQSCSSGTCTLELAVAGCPQAGWGRCSGTCFDLQTDKSHCGSCTNVCSGGQSCSSGTCTAMSVSDLCAYPKTKCGSTCVDLQTDVNNCGVCGTVCNPGTFVTKKCSAGHCVPK